MSLHDVTNHWVVPGLAFLADWSIRWGILLAMLLLWLAVRPPRRAATRYLLGTVVLASGVLLPAVPRWGTIAISWPWKTTSVAEPEAPRAPLPVGRTVIGAADLIATDAPAPPRTAMSETITDQPRQLAAPPSIGRRLPLGPWHWTALAAAAVWNLVVIVLTCRLIGGTIVLARLRREAEEVDETSRRLLDDCCRVMALSRRVGLAIHPAVGSPVTLGGRAPVVLVPADWDSWTVADRRVCLLHELAHLARRDDYAKLVQELIRVPFFFHPLVRSLLSRLDRERELLCDETVVALGVDPPAYARLLLALARRPGRLLPLATTLRPGCLPFLDRGTVAARIERLLEDDMSHTPSPPSIRHLFTLGTMTLAVALGAGGVGVRTVGPELTNNDQPARPLVKAESAAPRQITGLILGPDGKPMADAVVVAGLEESERPNHQVFKTDYDGQFTWSIPEGSVSAYLVAHKEGLAPVFWMSWLDTDKRGDHVELKLRQALPLSATLVDAAGRPVAHARVRIELLADTGTSPRGNWTMFRYVRREVIGGSPLEALFETTTDQNGLFTFRSFSPEKWLMLGVTSADGTEMRVRAKKEVRGPETTTVVDAGFVVAPPGEPNCLVAFPAARVKGRVVTTLPGVSVSGLRVSYQASTQAGEIGHNTNFGMQKVTTGADGTFLIDGLNEGTINVFIHGKGAGEAWTYRAANDVVLNSGDTAEVAFELIRGVDVEGKVVLQGAGTPVAEAGVGVYGPFRPRTGAMTQGAKTDAQGRYHYRLPPGETYLYVMGPPPGFTRLPGEGSSRTITIPEGTSHYEVPPIEIAAAVTPRGRVLDMAGAPVVGATIVGTCVGNVCQPFPNKETVTDARGEFKLPEGGYNTVIKGQPARLLIRLIGGAEHEASPVPSDDGVVTVKLPVRNEKPTGIDGPQNVGPDELAGVVVDTRGKPLEGVEVDAWTWYPGNETRTNNRGEFRLHRLDKDRKVEVVFRKPSYTPQLFITQPTGTQGWIVVLGNKTYFEGRVTSPDGKPVANALIRANQGPKRADGVMVSDIWTETRTDGDGRYRLYAQADVYDIQVRVPGVGSARLKDTALSNDEAKRLDIALMPGVKFRAKLVDSLTGKPVAGVRLWHWQHKGIEGKSDHDGIVTIADMLPGPFNFSVEAAGYARWWSDQCSTQWAHRQIL
jgi:beta-lactamase regulating signal transducer with metallopeptidase domain